MGGCSQQDLAQASGRLCADARGILDFGCGTGMWLFKCFLRGTKSHAAIDISKEASRPANETKAFPTADEFTFACGGSEVLKSLPAGSYHGVILSHIADNLIPADAAKVPGGEI